MATKRKVSFIATKKVNKEVDVVFRSRSGERIAFTATKRVPKQIHVSFYARRPK